MPPKKKDPEGSAPNTKEPVIKVIVGIRGEALGLYYDVSELFTGTQEEIDNYVKLLLKDGYYHTSEVAITVYPAHTIHKIRVTRPN